MIERLFDSMFCLAKYPDIPCQRHKQCTVTYFCLHSHCQEPFLCGSCKDCHNPSHKNNFVSVKEIFQGNLNKRVTKILSDYSIESIEKSREQVIDTLNTLREEFNRNIQEVIKNTNRYFDYFTIKSQRMSRDKEEFDSLCNIAPKIHHISTNSYRRLIELYNKLSVDCDDLNGDHPSNAVKELMNETKYMKEQLNSVYFNELKEIFQKKVVDYNKLKIDYCFKIPGSQGVGLDASAYMNGWNILAVGYKEDGKGSLALWDLKRHKIVATLKDIHTKVIIHVVWVPSKSLLVTCAHDTLIKAFRVRLVEGNVKLEHRGTLRGHTDWIRCLSFIEDEQLLVSAGTAPNLKLWDLDKMKRLSIINTSNDGELDGSLAYIPNKKLIGAGFKTGYIRFYHITKRNLVTVIPTGYTNYYCSGLQYLPKRKLIVAHVYYKTTKIWSFDENKNVAKEKDVIISESNVTGCIIPNEDESQLLLTSVSSYVEAYDINRKKIKNISLSPHISKTKSPVYLSGLGKISICDLTSENICLLKN